jgi:cellulose synthase/poly-beta-1,6-N-acetylglucosamine synthase-like glycosyltransferase
VTKTPLPRLFRYHHCRVSSDISIISRKPNAEPNPAGFQGGKLYQTSHAKAAFGPELSVVVPVYNNAGTLGRCLEAVKSAPGPTREILVVDDGSNDGSGEIAASLGVRTIRHHDNHGCGIARNTGVEQTTAPIIVFVDSDVIIHPDALLRISDFMAKQSDCDAVFGSYDAKPTDPSFVSQYRNLLHRFTHQNGCPEAQTFWTGLGAVRRPAFEQVGGFNPTYRGIPDVAFGLDLSDAGFRIRLDRDMLCTHLKTWTLRSMVMTDIFMRAFPWSKLVFARRSMTNDLNTSTINRIGVLAASATLAFAAMAMLIPAFAALMLLSLIGNVLANTPVLDEFRKARGLGFALRVVPLHFLHQLCAATGFALALKQLALNSIAPLATKFRPRSSDAAGAFLERTAGKLTVTGAWTPVRVDAPSSARASAS